ncbi:MAG: CoA transferase [Acidobacteriota bacterium]|nr:CoA transferase [Acidobacteriota bacterium]
MTNGASRRRGKARLPLRGFRVVSTAVNLPGPAAAARLRLLGAKVVKVEPPSGDQFHAFSPDWYRELNAGQTILTLNLKKPRDRARFDRLLDLADLLLTASRPSALRRLGLDWPHLHARFPRLSHAALVGYAAPRQEIPGHDLTYIARAGAVDPPRLPISLWTDIACAERLAAEDIALLLGRQRSGNAAFREVSVEEVAAAFAQPLRFGVTTRAGILGGQSPRYNIYRARQGWVAVATLESHFWGKLLRELNLKKGTKPVLAAAFRKRSAKDWERWAIARDLPIVAVREIAGPTLK